MAVLLGDRARVAMLTALADGRALPAGELARRTGVHRRLAGAGDPPGGLVVNQRG